MAQTQTAAEPRNPWLNVPSAESAGDARPEAASDEAAALTLPRGPVSPQRGVEAPTRQLPVVARPAAALWVVGVHGGAGEATMAAVDDGWAAGGHAWPAYPAGVDRPQVVVVARSHATGLEAARAAATQWATGNVPVELLGLVVMPDAPGRRPRPLRELEQLAAGGYPRAWRIPWVEAWRLDPPDDLNLPQAMRRLRSELLHLVKGPSS